jgi:arabinofuranan 3-O-arabinosyltransferase
MPDVTFVIPTRNNAATIEACLRSCREQEGPSVEVVVVDNHSTDGTREIAEALADRAITAGPERSAQRNHGVRIAGSPLVAVIDSDMTLHQGVATQLVAAFADDPGLGAVVLPEHGVGSGLWGACRGLEKRLYIGEASVEAARGFRREAFLEVGGYDEDLVGGEDWDLPDRVVARGWHLGRTGAGVDHHEVPTTLLELFRKKRYYGRGVAAYRERAGDRARPLRRPVLRRHHAELRARPLVTAALAVIKIVEAAGLLLGMWDHRHRRVA